MNYDAFNNILPASSSSSIIDSATQAISGLSKPAILLCAVFLTFIVLDLIIDMVQRRKEKQQ